VFNYLELINLNILLQINIPKKLPKYFPEKNKFKEKLLLLKNKVIDRRYVS